MKLFENKVAVITGGNSGIGLASAKLLAEQGAQVAIFGRNAQTLEEARVAIGGNTLAVAGDIANLKDIDRLYAEVVKHFKKIDVLFVNAGIFKGVPAEQVDEAFYDEQFNANVKGAYFTIQKAIPFLSNPASVILNASTVIHTGMAGTTVYSATKAAVRSLARTFSAELAGRGVRVNVVSPGPITTPIFGRLGLPAEVMAEVSAGMINMVPLKRFGTAEEIAAVVSFLASDASSFLLGAEILADGGIANL